jgi:hypothetical protein
MVLLSQVRLSLHRMSRRPCRKMSNHKRSFLCSLGQNRSADFALCFWQITTSQQGFTEAARSVSNGLLFATPNAFSVGRLANSVAMAGSRKLEMRNRPRKYDRPATDSFGVLYFNNPGLMASILLVLPLGRVEAYFTRLP